MRVLIACEFSGLVCREFRKLGHDAYSCDLLQSEIPGPWHFQCDVLRLLEEGYRDWDLLIAFPPCTHLTASGARWFRRKRAEQKESVRFVKMLAGSGVGRICIENPVGILSREWRKPDQIVQPYMFGHGETKATCLWLNNLPLLQMTKLVGGRNGRVHHEPPSADRWKNRSRTLPGIAEAMAKQWSVVWQ